MECEKREVDVYRQNAVITDQFYIDDDYNVPDVKSDVQKVVFGTGAIRVEALAVVENYLRVSGRMDFRILYVTDEGDFRLEVLEGKIPFEEMIYAEEAGRWNPFVKQAQAELTVSMIHSRKLNIKALAELQICQEKEEVISLTTDIEAGFPVYKKYREQELLKLILLKKDTCRIKEEVGIGGTKESIGTLLWTETASRKLDTRLAGDELLIQGELSVFCLYESLEGKADWTEQIVPYESRVECRGAGDHMYHQICTELTEAVIEPRLDEDGEMRLLGLEATLEMRLFICEEEKLQVLEDMYSLTQECRPQYRDVAAERLLMQNHSKCKVTERLSLPEIKDEILQICHSSARVQVEHIQAEDTGVRVEGVLHICFLYVRSSDTVPFDVWQGMVPFSCLLESRETAPDMNCDISCGVEQMAVGLLGSDEVEVKAVLTFHSFLRGPVHIRNIEEVSYAPVDLAEMEKRPGIVGYIVKEGDDLWKLAKAYSTTTEGIREVNELETDEIKEGDKLLIFKENMSIL